ncbi:TetR/AcrR family transcriptional regulator [Amycolatopsis acidiphila]|uniref:TetR/AcrR family transcriptional regulator n=1 Tax=Amycolatopsis acidiphila TaxID=715473 RepID=A0A558A3C4_9PSEU|nr:TetR/AcrR family transcriptional regulator [Amycolatopsis acidiphila]TVT18755.1 TetR/AcrR family transcriptional regulator [Amycolatopsis acidiphila]UIJ56941.1 TetR/AcrR family transcriptional regulator [Amycolatopsis acidiphila]GHG54211.1 TetR family transcriptional regulator [Amycolatopsis acidiphila]
MVRAQAETGQRPSPVRERILAAADALFYAEGIRAVSADRIIAEAQVSKVTFYRHFPAKDDLVLAYLQGRAEWERSVVEQARAARPGDPAAALTLLAEAIAETSCAAGFRGCPFINAAAEYADPGHPVRRTVAAHRAWFAGLLTELLAELGVAAPAPAVEHLMMLRDGAMVGGYLGTVTQARSRSLVAAGRAVVQAALRG